MEFRTKLILLILLWSLGSAAQTIPSGTIIPVQLNSSLNSQKSKTGQRISARVMQDVPLPSGQKIRAGSKIEGTVDTVRAASDGHGAQIDLRFNQLRSGHQRIPIVTSVRAVASPMEVEDAQVPPMGTDRGTPWAWMTRNLIGGEVAYGEGGPVERGTHQVGRALVDGVLAHVRANPEAGCPGESGDEARAQAFWVFSSDACGVYGLEDVKIVHQGRTPGIGVITLCAEHGDLNIRSGSGLLLRVLAP